MLMWLNSLNVFIRVGTHNGYLQMATSNKTNARLAAEFLSGIFIAVQLEINNIISFSSDAEAVSQAAFAYDWHTLHAANKMSFVASGILQITVFFGAVGRHGKSRGSRSKNRKFSVKDTLICRIISFCCFVR